MWVSIFLLTNAFVALLPYAGGAREVKTVFYMHDVPTASQPSAVRVAGGNSSSPFGVTFVFDDVLTEHADPASTALGAGQGVYSLASHSALDLWLAFTAVFRHPSPFAGSTIAMQGADRTGMAVREIAVAGGTGHFRFARGFATIETMAINGLNAILRFNVTARM